MSTSKEEKIVAAYLNLRETKRLLKHEYDMKVAEVDEDMGILEQAMKEFIPEGATSARFDSGTVIRSVRTTFATSDWWVVKEWAKNTNNLQMLQNRFNDSAVAEYLATTGELPPGVLSNTQFNITVRKR